MMTSASMVGLYDLVQCLRRPVRMGWLTPCVASAALTLAACRADLAGVDIVAACDDLHAALNEGGQP